MYRTVGMAIIALAVITLPTETALASSGGGKTTAATQHPPKPGGGVATPQTKKLSGKAGAACFRACMHGVSGASWGNFCDYSCFGGR